MAVFIMLVVIFLEQSRWSKLTASGTGPSPRDKLASAVIGEKIYVFGGFGPKSTDDVSFVHLSK